MVILARRMSMWRRISGRTPWPIEPKPTITRLPGKATCFIRGLLVRAGVGPGFIARARCPAEHAGAAGTVAGGDRLGSEAGRLEHRGVAHLDQAGPVEAVERGAQGGAIG